jgi:hypothetical protein
MFMPLCANRRVMIASIDRYWASGGGRIGRDGGMPRAEIASKQAIFTLSQLLAELAGKFAENRNAGVKIKTAMMQVEAVLQMLQPSFDVRSISAKRRNKSNPWFKRGTLFRSAVDVLRRGRRSDDGAGRLPKR